MCRAYSYKKVSIPREEKVAKLKAFVNFKHISIVRGYLFPIPRIPSVPNNLRIPVPFCDSVINNNQMSSNMNYEEIVDFVKNQKGFHDM